MSKYIRTTLFFPSNAFIKKYIRTTPVRELLCRDGLPYVISGILARGIPGFRIGLCCFTHATVWQCECCSFLFSLLCFAIPIPRSFNAVISFSPLVTELDRRSPSSLCGGYDRFGCGVCVLLLRVLFFASCAL